MGRGLGELQRKILERLKTRTPDPFFDHINRKRVKFDGWHHVGTLTHEVINNFDVWDDYDFEELTESEKQTVWRAIRTLEKRGLVESRLFPINWPDRNGYFGKPGGASRQKAIRLVQPRNQVN